MESLAEKPLAHKSDSVFCFPELYQNDRKSLLLEVVLITYNSEQLLYVMSRTTSVCEPAQKAIVAFYFSLKRHSVRT